MSLFSELLGASNAQDHTGLFSTSSKYYAQRQPSRPSSASDISQPGVSTDLSGHALTETSEQPKKKRKRTQVLSQTAPPSVELSSHPQPESEAGSKGKNRFKASTPTAAATKPTAQAQSQNLADQGRRVQDTASLPAKRIKKLPEARSVPVVQAEGHAQHGDSSEEEHNDDVSGTADADRSHRTIFVGNLLSGTSRRAVKHIFSRYGQVEKVYLRSLAVDPGANVPRRVAIITGQTQAGAAGNAYVVFADEAAAQASLAHNMQVEGGRHLRVDSAVKRPQYDPTRSVFIGNLPFVVDTEDLLQYLENHCASQPGLPSVASHVTALRIVRDPATSSSKGIAFAELSSKAAMYAALKADGAPFQKRELRVTRLKPASAQKGTAPTQRRPGRKPQGAAAKGAQLRMQKAAPSRESWQGTRTKGPSKVVQSQKASGPRPKRASPAKAPPKQTAKAKAQPRRATKRPAVAARKALRSKR